MHIHKLIYCSIASSFTVHHPIRIYRRYLAGKSFIRSGVLIILRTYNRCGQAAAQTAMSGYAVRDKLFNLLQGCLLSQLTETLLWCNLHKLCGQSTPHPALSGNTEYYHCPMHSRCIAALLLQLLTASITSLLLTISCLMQSKT